MLLSSVVVEFNIFIFFLKSATSEALGFLSNTFNVVILRLIILVGAEVVEILDILKIILFAIIDFY